MNDNAEVSEVDAGMRTLENKAHRDGYEFFLHQLIEDLLSVSTAGIVHIGFERIGGAEVCVVTVASSGKPVFARSLEGGAGHVEFWVRIGNATRQLHGDDVLDYKEGHWGD